MEFIKHIFLSLLIIVGLQADAQKRISDFSIVYDNMTTDYKLREAKPITGTTSIYVKGNMSRFETLSQSFSSTTIFNGTTGYGAILREVSGQKILIHLNQQDWHQINAEDERITFTITEETKTIAGYKCIRANGKTSDGSTFSVYFTSELVVDNADYSPKFKNLSGLPLEYELTKGNYSIKYSVAKINLNPVPESKFDLPKIGYREMTYEESKKLTKR
jgi:GLPGLI family protein